MSLKEKIKKITNKKYKIQMTKYANKCQNIYFNNNQNKQICQQKISLIKKTNSNTNIFLIGLCLKGHKIIRKIIYEKNKINIINIEN